MKKYFSKLTLAIVAAVVLSLGVAVPAMAATPDPLEPVEVGITKEINTPAGTSVPALDFNFNIRQLVANEAGTGYVVGFAPGSQVTNFGVRTASFPAGMAGPELVWQAHVPGVTPVEFNVLDGVVWPHAGDFLFVVYEQANTNPTVDADPNMTLTYTNASFVLMVRVSNCEATGTLVPTQAAAFESVFTLPGTDGRPGTNSVHTWNDATKSYDITPGEPGDPGTDDERVLTDPSTLRFVNDFTRIIRTGGLESPALAVSKNVTGGQANLNTLYFPFTINLTIPALAITHGWTAPDPLTDLVGITTIAAPGTAITPTTNHGLTVTGAAPNFVVTVNLKHNERIAFPELPEGTTFWVEEAATARYAPSAIATIGGAAAGTFGSDALGNINTILRVPAATPAPGTFAISLTEAGATGGNTVAFTNTHHEVPFTGLVIGSMPILAVLLGATVLLAMMVASRSRQRIEQLPVAH